MLCGTLPITMKKRSLTHREKAIARIVALIKDQIIVQCEAVQGHVTVGPWTPSGPGRLDRYAVFGYRLRRGDLGPNSNLIRDNLSVEDAATVFESLVGSGRARDAAIAADKKHERGAARVEMDKNGNAVAIYDWTRTVRVSSSGAVTHGVDGKPPRGNPSLHAVFSKNDLAHIQAVAAANTGDSVRIHTSAGDVWVHGDRQRVTVSVGGQKYVLPRERARSNPRRR